jgi:hypothetical protein
MTVPVPVDLDHRCQNVGGEPLVFHCHHYNTYLQRTIQDAESVDSTAVLIGAAAEVAYSQLTKAFADEGLADPEARKALAVEIYSWAGFGTFDLSAVGPEGGSVETPNSHYAMAWKVKWGKASDPVCHFASGWLAGATAAIYDTPNGSYVVTHEACAATETSETCAFTIVLGEANYEVFPGAKAPEYYDRLFRQPDVYKAEPLTSKAMGDEVTSFRVRRQG